MTSAFRLWGIACALLGATPATLPAPPSYAYDAYAPLELSVDASREERGLRIDSISYRAQAQIVHAVLVTPQDPRGAMPGVLFAHGLGDPVTSDHSEFLEDAKWLARRGVISLLPDEPWAASGWFEHIRSTATDERDSIATVVALRRGLDVLLGRVGIDPQHIAFVGHDFGAMYGALLAGADPRPAYDVFMAPTIALTDWFLLDTARPPADPVAYRAKMAAFDLPAALASASIKASFLQFGAHDRYVAKTAADAFAQTVHAPDKTVTFYPTDHALQIDAASDDRRAWLAAHLLSR